MTTNPTRCYYCRSSVECRGSAWTTLGRDVEAFERNHSADRRAALKIARTALSITRAADKQAQRPTV